MRLHQRVMFGVALLAAGTAAVEDIAGRCCLEGKALAFVPVNPDGTAPACSQPIATAAYQDLAHTASNFGKLRIEASDDTLDAVLRYRAAGFLEGYLTAVRIWHHFNNMKAYFEQELYPGVDLWGAPMQWLEEQQAWARQQVQEAKDNPPVPGDDDEDVPIIGRVWPAVELLLAQFDGLVEGYAARVTHEHAAGPQGEALLGRLERRHHMFMQNNGELYDIVDGWLAGAWNTTSLTLSSSNGGAGAGSSADKVPPSQGQQQIAREAQQAWRQRWLQSRSAGQWLSAVAVAERCTGIVKVTGDLDDLLVGHATWDTFTNMLRVYKHYDFGAPGFGRLSFSSYPGETFSDDDFYLSESGLVVLETTNHVFNMSVYEALTPYSLLSWQRVRAAMLLAGAGEEWVKVFSAHNSGTYNNQYMVVDTNKFKPKADLAPGLLWVIEQLPGLVVAMDATDVLARGYWGSYNVPYFAQIYNSSGYPEVVTLMEEDQAAETTAEQQQHYEVPISWLRYQSSPRAALFRRDQAAADDLDSFKQLIRYNNYRHDPYSKGAPQAAICGREDLPAVKRGPGGLVAGGASAPGAARKLQAGWAPASSDMHSSGLLGLKLEQRPKGCYDGKVTSYKLARQLQSEVVNGPTTSHGLPAFSWEQWPGQYVHMGQPTTFNYEWERMAPEEVRLPQ